MPGSAGPAGRRGRRAGGGSSGRGNRGSRPAPRPGTRLRRGGDVDRCKNLL